MRYKTIITILCMILLASMVGAVSVTNVKSPLGTSTTTRSVDFTFTLDAEPVGCWFEIGLSNGTTLGNYTNGTISTAKTGKEYSNTSYAVPIDSAVGNSHNWSIYCGATAAGASLIDTKTFNIRVATPTSVLPVEGTIYDTLTISPSMNVPVAINRTAGNICQYNLTLTNGTSYAWVDLNSTDNLTWYNASAFTTGIDSAVNDSHTMDYRCNDTTGMYTGTQISFKVDSTSPTYTWNNATRSSSVASFVAAVTDNTTVTCTGTLYDRLGVSQATLTGTNGGEDTSSQTCTYSIQGSSVGSDGAFNVEATVIDGASNSATKSNKSAVLQTLTAGWNVISWADAKQNLSAICSDITGCTQTSWYNNTARTFTTYSAVVPSVNAGINVSIGENLHIYVSADTYLIMNDHYSSVADENQSISDGWNILSLTQNATLNTTLYSSDNITWASKYDQDTGKYYTCSKSLTKCAGTTSGAIDIELELGTAVWILSNDNVSINRTEVSG